MKKNWIYPCITLVGAVMITGIFMKDTYKSQFIYMLDGLSNLQPIIQYKYSILQKHTLPIYTHLWFGGWPQWKNPLSSVLYFPVTAVYLLFPLNTATKILFFVHILFSIIAGSWLTRQFINKWYVWLPVGVVLTSPMVAMIYAGHFEKIFSWPWVILGLGFLFSENMPLNWKGFLSGACLGIIPLTGSNYYTFYAIILFILVLVSYFSKKLTVFFILGASLGLLHLPSVLGLVNVNRADELKSIANFKMNFNELANILFLGLRKLEGVNDWEGYSLIGIPMGIALIILIFVAIKNIKIKKYKSEYYHAAAIVLSIIINLLIVTGWIYKSTSLLNTFRVPSRVGPFLGLAISLIVMWGYKIYSSQPATKNYVKTGIELLLILSSFQVIWYGWQLRPMGTDNWIQNNGITQLSNYLKKRGANEIWVNQQDLTYQELTVGLMNESIPTVNTYFGDMGQSVKVSGVYCGYSFDYLIGRQDEPIENYTLIPSSWGHGEPPQKVDINRFSFKQTFMISGNQWNVYSVKCSS